MTRYYDETYKDFLPWQQELANVFIDAGFPVATIERELIQIVRQRASQSSDAVHAIAEEFLSRRLAPILDKSFNERVIIFYRESMNELVLHLLHRFLRNRACNITNFVVVAATTGLKQHYYKYLALNEDVGFQIIELPVYNQFDKYNIAWGDDKNGETELDKDVQRVFSFFGGWSSQVVDPNMRSYQTERAFYLSFMLQFDNIAHIEMLSDLDRREHLENFLEYESHFSDWEWVSNILDYYDIAKETGNKGRNNLVVDVDPIRDEQMHEIGYQQRIESKCFFSIARETFDNCAFPTPTEKTIRCFANHTVPIPLSGRETIAHFRDLGFWIPDLVDYSYLQADTFKERYEMLYKELDRLAKIPLDFYQDYYYTNIEKFKENKRNLYRLPDQYKETLKRYIKEWK